MWRFGGVGAGIEWWLDRREERNATPYLAIRVPRRVLRFVEEYGKRLEDRAEQRRRIAGRCRASSSASSNGVVLIWTADDQLNEVGLLTPKDRTDPDSFEHD